MCQCANVQRKLRTNEPMNQKSSEADNESLKQRTKNPTPKQKNESPNQKPKDWTDQCMNQRLNNK